jgi:hypothetical protein
MSLKKTLTLVNIRRMRNKKKINDLSNKEETTSGNYYFGKIEILEFEQLNLPQLELSVFASADIVDGGRGGTGSNDMARRTLTIAAPAF